MNSCLISYDWNNGKMQLTKLNQEGQMVWKKDFLSGKSFIHPSDVEFGIKGEIYVLEYGSAWRDNVDGKLKKVTYSEIPIVEEQGLASDSRLVGMDLNHQGTLLMSKSTCFSCHQANNQSVGPSFANVAKRYENQEGADVTLAKKILAGGSGSWGEVPMPPHPQFNEEQLSQIVDVILSVGISGHKESK
jgi:cytochrome c